VADESEIVAPGARPSPGPEVRRDLFTEEIEQARKPGPEVTGSEGAHEVEDK
jgi:hypothetical protein